MRLLKKDHFALYHGRPARFNDDFLNPFMSRFFERMKEADRPVIFFVQGFPQSDYPSAFYFRRLKSMKEWTSAHIGNMPCLVGDFGFPFSSGGKGRATGGCLRPYPVATAGVPLLVRWDRRRALFRFRFRAEAAIEAPTEIYAPPDWLGPAPLVTVSGGLAWEYREEEQRILIYNRGFGGEAEISAAPGG
jgi:hypothetical protein